jgi:hypothetical protein
MSGRSDDVPIWVSESLKEYSNQHDRYQFFRAQDISTKPIGDCVVIMQSEDFEFLRKSDPDADRLKALRERGCTFLEIRIDDPLAPRPRIVRPSPVTATLFGFALKTFIVDSAVEYAVRARSRS